MYSFNSLVQSSSYRRFLRDYQRWVPNVYRVDHRRSTNKAERTPSPHDMNRPECRTKRIDSVCEVTRIPLCARDGPVIKWGRGEGETLSIHVVWTR